MIKLKNKPLKLLKEDSLSNLNEHKQLSVQVSLDGFSFCIVNLVNNELEALHNYPLNEIKNAESLLNYVKQILKTELLLQEPFETLNVIYNNSLSTLVPSPLFDKNNLKDYLKFNVKLLKNDFFAFDYLVNNEMVNVYVPYVNINNLLIEKYGAFNYKHISTVLINGLISTFKNKDGQQFIVYVQQNNFQIVIINNNKLIFYNTFNFKTQEDFIYYILFVAEQLKLNPEEFNLYLAGKISSTDNLFKIAYKYIRNVSMLNYKPNFHTFNEITEPIKREFFTLLHF